MLLPRSRSSWLFRAWPARDRRRHRWPRRRSAVGLFELESLEDRTVVSSLHPTVLTDGGPDGGPGSGSLRAAILASNADPGKGTDTILLDSGTYTLTLPGSHENAGATGDLDITTTRHKVLIQGTG